MSKAALVTGAGVRIGRAIALDLAAQGWAVAIHYNQSAEPADKVVADIHAQGGRAIAVDAELADEAQVATLIDRAASKLGPLSCLVNNASVFEHDDALGASRDSWDRHMEVNLRAPFVLTQALADQLPEAAQGQVINIIDQRVWNLTPHFTSYTLSKAGLWTLTQTLAVALAPRLRVNAIGPGPTLPSPRQSEQQFETQWRAMPLQRPAGLDEICAAVRFILAAPAMTGQMIALDSGQHLGWIHPPHDAPPDE
ncbi:SDR family oxidoreductase [Magnetospira sp. QH-2]|uniref:SDR family oxidoreductase n=1 Tax=Magnetospira sp. (strain QH-2) TaxID=1288970 RepID=UPI0003E81394|nr:SDR family oxidoreductase [Magnetospira sp. QH-2]CCQ74859.1 putative short chain dehydrogenase/reductase [Magnetospira sp. QH-2]